MSDRIHTGVFNDFHGKSDQGLTASRLAAVLLAALIGVFPQLLYAQGSNKPKPTVVLVHGALAGSSSWDNVVARLFAEGYPVVAVANPLRGVRSDAVYVANLLDSIRGPVILVGHSYGGNVISYAANGKSQVRALVFVSGVAQFAADVPLKDSKLMAATQGPITEAALNESGDTPAWKTIPSWFLHGSLDKNIPPAVHAFMAKRAGAKRAVEVKGASHVVMISHPDALVKLIDEAAEQAR